MKTATTTFEPFYSHSKQIDTIEYRGFLIAVFWKKTFYGKLFYSLNNYGEPLIDSPKFNRFADRVIELAKAELDSLIDG